MSSGVWAVSSDQRAIRNKYVQVVRCPDVGPSHRIGAGEDARRSGAGEDAKRGGLRM